MEKITPKFKIGDKVQLMSGGQIMTVNLLKQSGFTEMAFNGQIGCVWFNSGSPEKGQFHQDALQKVS